MAVADVAVSAEQSEQFSSFVEHLQAEHGSIDGKTTNLNQLKSFYDFIVGQPNGSVILDSIVSPAKTAALTTASVKDAGFSNETGAAGSLFNVWVYNQLQVKADGLGRSFDGKSFGLVAGLPGGALFGTLYYNSSEDVKGDCDMYIGATPGYLYANFSRGGSQFAAFHAFNVGANAGGAWGSGTWK
ncbi:hypothetical protein B0T26DRAFT_677121 [Lasiosphaeria miniovina]|uniref:Uncharacterized protein n=1 Tax=Lasiosphaeria miniovina TaxID=1954250 RepID=A0AA40AB63_9PEZI|nr:uncharacterized protein B0T26DRAFT_677121 [Lasiosphaeria miniovina]KAK0712695.1 hypothetical protein B0T26DRAFT_677121 [Lasiosphaeria miniovina]